MPWGTREPMNAKAGAFGDNKDAAEHFLKLHEIMRGGAGVPKSSRGEESALERRRTCGSKRLW